MRKLGQVFRILHIYFVWVRYGLDQILLSTPWFFPLRFLAYINPWNWYANRNLSRGERIRLMMIELGPIFVKFGQLLSTRRDFIPDDIANELAKLQDRVPAFDGALVRGILEKTYHRPLEEMFAEVSLTALASASIAQVHVATLHDGTEVAIKILRPGIKRIVQRDLDILFSLANLAQRYWSGSKRLHPRQIVEEFQKILLDEFDLRREAANATQLRRNFAASRILYIPEIHWDYARKNVMVMERIHGIPVTDIPALQSAGINFKLLAERGVEIFFTQVFRDCFFHADMHPGNIFVDVSEPQNPTYIAVDFGIIGTLTPTDQRYIAENLLAFFRRDYRRVAQLHVESGWVRGDTRIDEFESAIRTVCEPIFDKPLKDISFGRLLLNLFQTAKRFHMEVQPQLLLLQKTLLSIEGLGRQLYPELDLWVTAKPFLERWLRDQVGPRAFVRKIRQNAPFWLEKMPDLPDLLYDILNQQQRAHSTSAAQLSPQSVPSMITVDTPQKRRSRRWFYIGIGITACAAAIINYLLRAPGVAAAAPTTAFWVWSGVGVVSLLWAAVSEG